MKKYIKATREQEELHRAHLNKANVFAWEKLSDRTGFKKEDASWMKVETPETFCMKV